MINAVDNGVRVIEHDVNDVENMKRILAFSNTWIFPDLMPDSPVTKIVEWMSTREHGWLGTVETVEGHEILSYMYAFERDLDDYLEPVRIALKEKVPHEKKFIHVRLAGTHPDHRGKGYCYRLYMALKAYCEGKGIKYLTAFTYADRYQDMFHHHMRKSIPLVVPEDPSERSV